MEIKSLVSRAKFGHGYDAKTTPFESFIARACKELPLSVDAMKAEKVVRCS